MTTERATQTVTQFEQVPTAIAKKIALQELKRRELSKRRLKIKNARLRTGRRK
jgi:hypothetical protein